MTGLGGARYPQPVDREIAAVLAGERCRPADSLEFARAAIRHGVAPLLVHLGAAAELQGDAARALQAEARREAALWAVRDRVLREIADAVRHARLDLLLVKGAHLGYVHYPDPAVRGCVDADLFVRPEHRRDLVELLVRIGFELMPDNVGDAALGQSIFARPGVPGSILDVHSRMLTSPAHAARLPFAPIWDRSAPLDAIGGGMRVPALEDALEIAILHQAVHHSGHQRLLWTYDLHVLLASMTPPQGVAFARRAAASELDVFADPIVDAQRYFPTAAGAVIALSARAALDRASVRAAGCGSPARRLLQDLRALPHWRSRIRLLRAHLVPPSAYMRQTYAPGSKAPLPVLYVARIVKGMLKGF